MPRQCKVCSSELRDEIDKLALSNHSFKWLEKWCRDRGLAISHMSIRRHCIQHIDGFNEVSRHTHIKSSAEEIFKNNELTPLLPVTIDPLKIDREELLKSLNCPTTIETTEELSLVSRKFLSELIVNQLSIVLAKQKGYMMGLTKYPNDEIRGLQTIIGIFESITSKVNSASSLLDINAVLNKSESSDGFDWQGLIDLYK